MYSSDQRVDPERYRDRSMLRSTDAAVIAPLSAEMVIASVPVSGTMRRRTTRPAVVVESLSRVTTGATNAPTGAGLIRSGSKLRVSHAGTRASGEPTFRESRIAARVAGVVPVPAIQPRNGSIDHIRER